MQEIVSYIEVSFADMRFVKMSRAVHAMSVVLANKTLSLVILQRIICLSTPQ